MGSTFEADPGRNGMPNHSHDSQGCLCSATRQRLEGEQKPHKMDVSGQDGHTIRRDLQGGYPGQVQPDPRSVVLTVAGKAGSYAVSADTIPLQVHIDLGPVGGGCGTFSRCAFNRSGSTLKCK